MKIIAAMIFGLALTIYATTFEKYYKSDYYEEGNCVIETSDSCYVIAGTENKWIDGAYNPSEFKIILLKLDNGGNLIWRRTYNPSDIFDYEFGYSVIETDDGGFLISGSKLIKTNSEGIEIWRKDIEANSICHINDGNFLLVGWHNYPFNTCMLRKIDINGNIIWENSSTVGIYCQQTIDDGFVVVGTTNSGDIQVEKKNTDGNEIWRKTFGGMQTENGYEIKQTTNGDYVIVGATSSFGNGDFDIWLLKIDSNGNTIWDKTFGGAGRDWGKSVQITTDGKYLIAGFTESSGSGLRDMWLIKTDENGNEIWNKTYGGLNEDIGNSLIETSNNEFLITGYTFSYDAVLNDVFLVKTDSFGNINSISDSYAPSTTELFQNYPNPFNPNTEISYSLRYEAQITLSVFNTKGELVNTLVNGKIPAGIHSVNFNGEGLNTGIYFYKLSVNGKAVQSRKMMMLK